MADDRITAGELRVMGIPVPSNIPDVASIPRSAMKMSVGEVTSMDGDKTVVVNVSIKFEANFEWIQLDLILDPEP